MALLATIPAATAALADDDDLTIVQASQSNGGGAPIGASVEVNDTLAPGSYAGSITDVIFGVRGYYTGSPGAFESAHVQWAVGAFDSLQPVALAEGAGAIATFETAEQATTPSGAAWTWADLATATVGLHAEFLLLPGQSGRVVAAKLYAKVSGENFTRVVELPATVGTSTWPALAGTRVLDAQVGDAALAALIAWSLGLSLESELSRVLLRNYPFAVLPSVDRNTWAGSAFSIGPPTAYFRSAGVAPEAGKLFEAAVEHHQDDWEGTFRGPGSTIGGDFKHTLAWQQACYAETAANIDAGGWVGVELGSAETATVPDFGTTPILANSVIQVRQQLKDPRQWELTTNVGGHAGIAVQWQIDPLQGVQPYNEGHHVRLVFDPFAETIEAWVDGLLRATVGSALYMTAFPWGLINVGLVAWSGGQSGACLCRAAWTGMTVAAIDTGLIGAGI